MVKWFGDRGVCGCVLVGLAVMHVVWGKLCAEVTELLRVKGVGNLRK